jgi:hypothetical protein
MGVSTQPLDVLNLHITVEDSSKQAINPKVLITLETLDPLHLKLLIVGIKV